MDKTLKRCAGTIYQRAGRLLEHCFKGTTTTNVDKGSIQPLKKIPQRVCKNTPMYKI